ncbi:MAG: FecR domain-containing protein [Magnetococcales bacterium]|nr:FecR domain-containing protein [Magnetococcales bacterium]
MASREVSFNQRLGSVCLVLLLLGVSLCQEAVAQESMDYAARALVAVGDVNVQARSAGATRPLVRGGLLYSGETVITRTGEAQIQFTDRMIISLYDNTRFAIDDYRFSAGEKTGWRAKLSLVAGALHALTGLIGKTDPQSYRMHTNLGTLGVRGTEYYSTLGETLDVTVVQGVVTLNNQGGSLDIQAGQSAVVNSVAIIPRLLQRPVALEKIQKKEKMPQPTPGGGHAAPPGAGVPSTVHGSSSSGSDGLARAPGTGGMPPGGAGGGWPPVGASGLGGLLPGGVGLPGMDPRPLGGMGAGGTGMNPVQPPPPMELQQRLLNQPLPPPTPTPGKQTSIPETPPPPGMPVRPPP